MIVRFNRSAIWLAIIIFLNLGGFYLINSENVPITDITIAVGIIFAVYNLTKYRGYKVQYRYATLFVIPIALAIIASIMAFFSYNQPFMLGFRAQRTWLFVMLMYFPISRLFQTNKISADTVLRVIDRINFVYFIIVLVQYIIGDRYELLHVMTNERYGSIRLYVSITFVMISYMVHLNKILEGKTKSKWDYFYVGIGAFMCLFVVKTRMRIVAFLAASLLLILKRKISVRKIFLLGVAIVAVGIFLTTDMGQDILTMALNPEDSSQDTSVIRDIGRVFYIEQTFKSPLTAIFGCGFPNTTWENTVSKIRSDQGINMNDHGILGIMFMYGLLFVTWMVVLYFKLIKDANECKKKDYIAWLMMGVFGLLTLYPDCYGNYISFPIIVALIENEVKVREVSRTENNNEYFNNTCALE